MDLCGAGRQGRGRLPQQVGGGQVRRSSLSMPLFAQYRPVGALNLYSAKPGFFAEAETRLAERFAREATVAVGIAAQAVLTDQLRASLASRAIIDQALGVIMAQQWRTAEQAFAILRSASQNRKSRPATSPGRSSPASRRRTRLLQRLRLASAHDGRRQQLGGSRIREADARGRT